MSIEQLTIEEVILLTCKNDKGSGSGNSISMQDTGPVIRVWKCDFPPLLEIMIDRPTSQSTYHPTTSVKTWWVIGMLLFQ